MKQQKTSANEVVRKAIDAFTPKAPAKMSENELLDLVSTKVKEAIEDTRSTRQRLNKTLAALDRDN